jgi:hypothetical protein
MEVDERERLHRRLNPTNCQQKSHDLTTMPLDMIKSKQSLHYQAIISVSILLSPLNYLIVTLTMSSSHEASLFWFFSASDDQMVKGIPEKWNYSRWLQYRFRKSSREFLLIDLFNSYVLLERYLPWCSFKVDVRFIVAVKVGSKSRMTVYKLGEKMGGSISRSIHLLFSTKRLLFAILSENNQTWRVLIVISGFWSANSVPWISNSAAQVSFI